MNFTTELSLFFKTDNFAQKRAFPVQNTINKHRHQIQHISIVFFSWPNLRKKGRKDSLKRFRIQN